MLGKKKYEPKMMYNVTIDDLVPVDNFYRKLERLLDLRFVYQDCKSLYGTTGNPSVDPVVFFKLNLVGYFEGITSDRELIREASDKLSVRYFLGYDIDEQLPWHSTISRTRGVIKQETFEKIFNLILRMCNNAGLIEGTHQSVDSTLVKANASLESLERKQPKLSVEEYVKRTYEDNEIQDTGKADDQKKDNTDNKDDNNRLEKTELKYINKENKDNKKTRTDINKQYISKTDPDARVASKPKTVTGMYYSTFYSVDSKKKVITDVFTEHADRGDKQILLLVVDRTEKRLSDIGMKQKELSIDKGFYSGKNLRGLEQRGIISYGPIPKVANNTGVYTPDKFAYDEKENVCICPNNKELKYSGYDPQKELMIFYCKKSDCQSCPYKEACCPKTVRKRLKRTIYYKENQRLRDRLKTPDAKRAAVLRKTGPEPLFGEAKMYHGLSKYMSRGIDKAQKNSYMIASVQNLKRLMTHWNKLKNKISQLKNFNLFSDPLARASFSS